MVTVNLIFREIKHSVFSSRLLKTCLIVEIDLKHSTIATLPHMNWTGKHGPHPGTWRHEIRDDLYRVTAK